MDCCSSSAPEALNCISCGCPPGPGGCYEGVELPAAGLGQAEVVCFIYPRSTIERRKFSREFRLEAVRLVCERDVAVGQAACDSDVHENMLGK